MSNPILSFEPDKATRADLAKLFKKLDKFPGLMRRAQERGINRAIIDIDREAKLLIKQTPRQIKYRTVGFAKKNKRRHHASAPGFAPAVDTGRLINSLRYWVEKFGDEVDGVNFAGAHYAAIHERRRDKAKRRPFFTPARLNVLRKRSLAKYVGEEVNKELKYLAETGHNV